jgi:hypothetical protein
MLTSYSVLRFHENLLNVRYVVKPAAAADPGPLYQDAHWKVYENPAAYPRAWVVHEVAVEPSQEAIFHRLSDPAVDLRQLALLEAPLSQALQEAAGAVESPRFRVYEADRIVMDVTAHSTGLLVLSEMHYPGWRATRNGDPIEIHRVNGGLRGIVVPRGENSITFEYAPASVYVGGAITLLTFFSVLLGWILLGWAPNRRKKRPV